MSSATSIRKEICVSDKSTKRGTGYELWGWLLFVVSALLFIAASIRSGDVVGLLGGVFFLIACVFFLASYAGTRRG